MSQERRDLAVPGLGWQPGGGTLDREAPGAEFDPQHCKAEHIWPYKAVCFSTCITTVFMRFDFFKRKINKNYDTPTEITPKTE